MKSESVVIHKGGKEERYKIYVEDYVLSYLKRETGTLQLSEIFFYGYSDRSAQEYIIYGAGRDKQIAVFEKYNLLEKVTCRLTQGGPVFMIREKDELYEVKGYDIFYHKNEEMQSYLVDSSQPCHQTEKQPSKNDAFINLPVKPADTPGKHLHNTMTLQLGIIFVLLIAIVINSTNSYDKMEQLNRSAKEVFFALENQEAEGIVPADVVQQEPGQNIEIQEDIEKETGQKDLQVMIDESEDEKEESQVKEEEQERENQEEDILKPIAEETGLEEQGETMEDETSPKEEDTEALSRSVTRYYEIEQGDTLYTISEEIYGDISKVQEICELNNISDPDDIRYGQKIILP